MKKALLIGLSVSLSSFATNADKKYNVCKAQCKEDTNCKECISSCQRSSCQATCYRKHNNFKESKACEDFRTCKLQKNDPCDPKPCLDAAQTQKECLEECNLIYDLSVEEGSKQDICSNECYCFRKDTTEYLGKAACASENCQQCDQRCQDRFKNHKNVGVKGVCR